MRSPHPPERVWILADDLTGAADSALPFWRAGRRATIVFSPDARWPENEGVVSICTQTRAMSEPDARATLARLVPRLPSDGLIFKKIDSTLRGWIGAECGPLLERFSDRPAYFAPAYPSKGRVLGPDGVYRVYGEPLASTEFAAETVGVPTDSTLPGFMAQHFGNPAGRVTLLPAATVEGFRALVAAQPQPALWIGSPGLAMALAGAKSVPPPAAVAPKHLDPAPIVVAVGSRRTLTRQQTEALERLLPNPVAAGGALLRAPSGDYDPTRASAVANELGERAATAASRLGKCGLILTGGDIAAATCGRLGIQTAEIVGEIEDGLPILRAGAYLIVTKAGGFGEQGSLVRAYQSLAKLLGS